MNKKIILLVEDNPDDRMHCQTGYDVMKSVEFPWPIAQIIFQHHERMDGSGYPSSLAGANPHCLLPPTHPVGCRLAHR